MPPSDPRTFYDDLAADYHLLFTDWQQSIRWQREVINKLILANARSQPRTVLDCACGIGTQALGLAQRGYTVTASDLSAESIAKAQQSAQMLGVSVNFAVADLRTLADSISGTFDVVIAFDNALPHLRDEDLSRALHQIRRKVASGGLFMASIRDYDALLVDLPQFTSQRVLDDADGRRIVFQVWDWAEDASEYTVNQFIVRQSGDAWQTSHYATTYYPVRRDALTALLTDAGFADVRWLLPEESGYYQPVVLAANLDDWRIPP
jgi:glycine/sarcosine N-methyltransferase